MDKLAYRSAILKQNKGVENIIYPPFSVAMSVYAKDNEKWFDTALNSIIEQTLKPNEIVLVIDGAIPQTIQDVIDKYLLICSSKEILLKIIQLSENKGLGRALSIAVDKCSNEIIARMDSDDISVKNRFEMQMRILVQHEEIDIVGGDIAEFIGNVENRVGRRSVPLSDKAIKKYVKKRCPFNHVTVMYRKKAVLKAGGYKDLFWNEDYYLWIRMTEKGCQMANTGSVLVNVRVGEDMYKRRGGKKYFKSELFLQNYMYKKQMIGTVTLVSNIVKRFIIQILMPACVRGWVFQKFARSKI